MSTVELSREAYRSMRVNGSMTPANYQVALFGYRTDVRRELGVQFGDKFWISPDLGTKYDVVIPPNGGMTLVDIALDPATLVPFSSFHPYSLSTISATTRSRFAQLGLEVPQNAFTDIARTFYWTPRADGTKQFGALVPVRNLAARPIEMSAGTNFFSGFYWNGKTLTGGELYNAVGNTIRISGKENETWRWFYGKDSIGKIADVRGIEFFIDEESRSWVPSGIEPMYLDGEPAINHNRACVDKYLQSPIPNRPSSTLVIAQTIADIELEPSVHGIVNMSVIPGEDSDEEVVSSASQTNSVLIRGGNTFGKMRTEILETPAQSGKPQTSLMQFVRAA